MHYTPYNKKMSDYIELLFFLILHCYKGAYIQ